jgi:hypothetical protein
VGREINPHVFTVEEFTRRVTARDHFISTALAAPKLIVIGNEDELTAFHLASVEKRNYAEA